MGPSRIEPKQNPSPHPGSRLGRLYPDIVIGPIDGPVAIIDAKYKPLVDPRRVDRGDLYQLNAYLALAPVPMGALAYVRFPEQTSAAYAENQGPWRTENGHLVAFTRLPATEAECVAALRTLVSAGV